MYGAARIVDACLKVERTILSPVVALRVLYRVGCVSSSYDGARVVYYYDLSTVPVRRGTCARTRLDTNDGRN